MADNCGRLHAPGFPQLRQRHLHGEDRGLRDLRTGHLRRFLGASQLLEQRQPPGILEPVQGENWRKFVAVVPEIDKAAARTDCDSLARGKMIEGGLERLPRHDVSLGAHSIGEHRPARVEADERDLGEPVDLGERVGECQQRGVEIGRHTERVRERGQRTRGHPAGEEITVRGVRRR